MGIGSLCAPVDILPILIVNASLLRQGYYKYPAIIELMIFLLRYRDNRDENGAYTREYWQLLTTRFMFVVVFEVSICCRFEHKE